MTKSEIISALQRIGLKPQVAAGQSFLMDETVVQSMITAADVKPADTILEIGPGLGILTKQLLQTGAKVVAVELDKRLFGWMKKKFESEKKLILIQSDIFRLNLNEYVKDGVYKLVANLPYSATSLVFRNFLTLPPRPKSLTVMVQKEVAARLTAQPGDMSLLALSAQYYGRPAYVFDVPRDSFFPPPKVTSAVVQVTAIRRPDPVEAKGLFRLARAGFAGRRKQLRNSLATVSGQNPKKIAAFMEKIGISPSARPQELSVDNWLELAKLIS